MTDDLDTGKSDTEGEEKRDNTYILALGLFYHMLSEQRSGEVPRQVAASYLDAALTAVQPMSGRDWQEVRQQLCEAMRDLEAAAGNSRRWLEDFDPGDWDWTQMRLAAKADPP